MRRGPGCIPGIAKERMQAEFIAKLTGLLGEYSASITWGCSKCSDLHGVKGEHMAVVIDRETVLQVPGRWLTVLDIKDYT